jgi:hypothetical protein
MDDRPMSAEWVAGRLAMIGSSRMYKVMIDDNFDYMDEDERSEHGTFSTAEEAVAACRRLVGQWLVKNYKPGMTAAELYEQYVVW